MTKRTTTADAVREAIAGHDDSDHRFATPNKQPEALRAYWESRQKNGPITIKRLPAGDWECDACGTHGSGWLDIEKHFKRTEHRVYTETRKP